MRKLLRLQYITVLFGVYLSAFFSNCLAHDEQVLLQQVETDKKLAIPEWLRFIDTAHAAAKMRIDYGQGIRIIEGDGIPEHRSFSKCR